jgi:hypothetical protein
MKRREFIALIGGAAGWPLAARAQPSRTLVVGWLHSASPGFTVHLIAAFRKGLSGIEALLLAKYEFDSVALLHRTLNNDMKIFR